MASAAHDAREELAVQSFSVVRGSKNLTAVFADTQKNPSDCHALSTTLESFQLYIGTRLNH